MEEEKGRNFKLLSSPEKKKSACRPHCLRELVLRFLKKKFFFGNFSFPSPKVSSPDGSIYSEVSGILAEWGKGQKNFPWSKLNWFDWPGLGITVVATRGR